MTSFCRSNAPIRRKICTFPERFPPLPHLQNNLDLEHDRNIHSSGEKIFALSAIGQSIQQMLDQKTGGKAFWIRAEISKVVAARSGHFYLDLVEEVKGRQQAKMRASIWKGTALKIQKDLGGEFEQVLQNGREIVCQAQVTFHPIHGFSLNIQSIDLGSMLGELERRKQATLATLRSEDALNRNKQWPRALAPQRILLIASPDTAGYCDFMAHIEDNEYGYALDVGVLPVAVQGVHAAAQITAAIKKADHIASLTAIDAVVILRGGGSALDLDVFNDLDLCRQIAASTQPVLTGIGHETDLAIADIVAQRNFKTPTDLADGLIDDLANFESAAIEKTRYIARFAERFTVSSREQLTAWQQHVAERPIARLQLLRSLLANTGLQLAQLTSVRLQKQQLILTGFRTQLQAHATRALALQRERVEGLQRTLAVLGPEQTLARGFSITRHSPKDGQPARALTNLSDLKPGDRITTTLASGLIESEITQLTLNSKNTPSDHGN